MDSDHGPHLGTELVVHKLMFSPETVRGLQPSGDCSGSSLRPAQRQHHDAERVFESPHSLDPSVCCYNDGHYSD